MIYSFIWIVDIDYRIQIYRLHKGIVVIYYFIWITDIDYRIQIHRLHKDTVHLLVMLKITSTSVNIAAFSILVFARVLLFSARLLDLLTLFLTHAIAGNSSQCTTLLICFIWVQERIKSELLTSRVPLCVVKQCHHTVAQCHHTVALFHTDGVNSGVWRRPGLEPCAGHLVS